MDKKRDYSLFLDFYDQLRIIDGEKFWQNPWQDYMNLHNDKELNEEFIKYKEHVKEKKEKDLEKLTCYPKDVTFITYGFGNKFIKELLHTNLDCSFNKPKKAWWGSPNNPDSFGWKRWCKSENWIPDRGVGFKKYFSESNKICWKLKEGSKVLIINNEDDLFILNENQFASEDWINRIDFYKIKSEGFSAVWLKNPFINGYTFYGWDCESIVVLDPSVIVQIKED